MRTAQTYKEDVVILIQHQILVTNFQRNAMQLEERIYIRILGVKWAFQSSAMAFNRSVNNKTFNKGSALERW